MNPIDYLRSVFLGTARARREHSQAVAAGADVRTGLVELGRLCEADSRGDHDAPIFLLSAGWRSGSTLLQRLIMSDMRVLLWGEPYDECGVIQAMAGTVKAFRSGWPPQDYYLTHHGDVKPGELSDDWIANLFPEPEALRQGHRAFFDVTFAQPAKRAGFSRWGIKEVRLSAQHAQYLKWLYPNARFIFLYRNPLDAYRSYSRYGRNWYDTWPDKPVFTPGEFGRHWRVLCEGFLLEEKHLGALLVRYEDLVTGNSELLERIEQHLDVTMDRSILGNKVGSSARGGEHAKISALEKALLRRAVSPLAQELGYLW